MAQLSEVLQIAGKPLLNSMSASSIANLKSASTEMNNLVTARDHRDADNSTDAIVRANDAFTVDDLPRLQNAWRDIPRGEWKSLVVSSARQGAAKCIAWMFQQIKAVHEEEGTRLGEYKWNTKAEEDLALHALGTLVDDENALMVIVNSGVFEYTGASHAMFVVQGMPGVLKRLAHLTNIMSYDGNQCAESTADIGCLIVVLLKKDTTVQLALDILDICSHFICLDGLVAEILGENTELDMEEFIDFCTRVCNIGPDWLIIKCCLSMMVREFAFVAIAGKMFLQKLFTLDKEKLPVNVKVYKAAYDLLESYMEAENDPMAEMKLTYNDVGVVTLEPMYDD